MAGVLDGSTSSRLPKHLIRGKQLASSISVSYDFLSLYNGTFRFQATPARQHTLEQLKQAVNEEINQLQTHLVAKGELQRIKTQVIADKIYSRDSLFGQAMLIGNFESIGMSWRDAEGYADKIRAVSPEQVREVAQLYLQKNKRTIAELHPKSINTKLN